MSVDANDLLGERWLLANDPTFEGTRDFNYKECAIGLPAEVVDYAARKGRSLVGHGALPSAKLCARCYEPFQSHKSDHQFCGELCRAAARREYMRDLMRRRRAA